ncbi:MAG TPA: hypothetical protein PKE31_09550 [Pseudomonadota bacterium]|nr:hypothetical protein [Pseudomonadota bacterium]HMU39244.1 hypothetical protein [Pseudomonadota bacterium]
MSTKSPLAHIVQTTVFVFSLCEIPQAHCAAQEEDLAAKGEGFASAYEAARKAYSSGDYQAAIPFLQAAYAVRPLPALLYNIGQAYRKLGKWSEAHVYLELYRKVHPGMTPETAAELDALLVEAREKERLANAPQVIEKTKLLYVAKEKPMPIWLRPLGVTTGLLGLGAIGIGGGMLGLNGTCTRDAIAPALVCEQVYSTRSLGIGLVAGGSAALLMGVPTFSFSFRRPSKSVLEQSSEPVKPLPSLQPLFLQAKQEDTAAPAKRQVPSVVPILPLYIPPHVPVVEPPPSPLTDSPEVEPPPSGKRKHRRRFPR